MAAQKQPPLTEYTCAQCGSPLRQDRWVYSRFTKNRYCFDLTACSRRWAKAKKSKA